jgi:hypothetical protein
VAGLFLAAIPPSLAAAALGFRTAYSTKISAFLLFFYMGTFSCYGHVGHRSFLIVAVTFVFAISDCGRSFSIDASRDSFFGKKSAPRMSVASGWPLKMIWILQVHQFFSAGLSKLRESGLDWVTSNNLQNYLVDVYYSHKLDGFSTRLGLGLWLSQYEFVCHVLAALALMIELFSPLTLTRRFRWWIFVLFFTQVSFHVMVTQGFEIQLAVYLCWVPWREVREWFTNRLQSLQREPSIF